MFDEKTGEKEMWIKRKIHNNIYCHESFFYILSHYIYIYIYIYRERYRERERERERDGRIYMCECVCVCV